jgi:hypothetical protein
MTKALFHFAVKRKIHIITVIEGIPLDDVDDEKAQRLAFVSTCQKFSTTMLTMKHEPLGESVIVGPAGAILGESTLDGRIHVGCLVSKSHANFHFNLTHLFFHFHITDCTDECRVSRRPFSNRVRQSAQHVLQCRRRHRANEEEE